MKENMILKNKAALLRVAFAGTLIAGSLSLFAQNTFPPTGSVGIGTNAPASLLHVKSAGAFEERLDSATDSSLAYYSGSTLLGRLWYPGGNIAGQRYFGFQNLGGDYLRFDANTVPMYFITNNFTRLAITPGGNIGIGTTGPTSALSVVGDVDVTGNIAAKYQDVAEWVPATDHISAGTVVVVDEALANHVKAASRAYDTSVAGVISERPGLILGEKGDNKVMVATTGRVRVFVDATKRPVHVGDLLVASEVEGYAMASEPVDIGGIKVHRPGTIIGKALEPLANGRGEVLALLTLQ
jgi:hypothetical protein